MSRDYIFSRPNVPKGSRFELTYIIVRRINASQSVLLCSHISKELALISLVHIFQESFPI